MSFWVWLAIVAFLFIAAAAVIGDEFGFVVSFVLIIIMFAGCQALVDDGKDLQTEPVTITETLKTVFDCSYSGGHVWVRDDSGIWFNENAGYWTEPDMVKHIASGVKSGACRLLVVED